VSVRTLSPVRLTGSGSRATAGRKLLHGLIGLASWVVLGLMWVWQLNFTVPENWFIGVVLIFALLVMWATFAKLWIEWCRSIYRRRHRRLTPISREVDFGNDSVGRKVSAPPGLALSANHVLISVCPDNVKHYRAAPVWTIVVIDRNTPRRPLPYAYEAQAA
jgi:hypothetical protein